MLAILFWCVKKMNLKASLNKGVENISDSIKAAELEKTKSENLVKAAQATIEKLPAQIEDIKKFNEQKTQTFKKQLEDSTQKSIKNIEQNVEKVVSIEEKKISNAITSETVANSIEASKNNIIKMLEDKPNLKYKFIDKSLEELDRIQL
jgi:F0F1-type ATP synthase membrane subunit b/b'